MSATDARRQQLADLFATADRASVDGDAELFVASIERALDCVAGGVDAQLLEVIELARTDLDLARERWAVVRTLVRVRRDSEPAFAPGPAAADGDPRCDGVRRRDDPSEP